MNKNTVVVGRFGPGCPRCGIKMEVRRHKAVTAAELLKPFYYAQWFRCVNGRCKTNLVMPEEHKVWNGSSGVVETPAAHQDVALDVLSGDTPTWPPWEDGPQVSQR